MNRIIKTLLLFLILSLSLSCTLQIAQNNEEKNLNLNYRVAQDMIGSTLRVRLYTTDNTIITEEERSITQESNKETFTFDFLDLGSTVKIQVDILKNDKLLYTATKETVIKDKNVINIDTLYKMGTFNVAPDSSQDLKTYGGTTFQVEIDGKTYSTPIGTAPVGIFPTSFTPVSGIKIKTGDVKLKYPHKITASVVNSHKEPILQGIINYAPNENETKQILMEKQTSYVLWTQGTTADGRWPNFPTKIVYSDPTKVNTLIPDFTYDRLLDFLQLSENEHLVIDGKGGTPVLYYVRNGENPQAITLQKPQLYGDIYKMNSLDVYNKYILVGGTDGSRGSYNDPHYPILFSFEIGSNPVITDYASSLSALTSDEVLISGVCIDGNTIYIATEAKAQSSPYKFKIYKSTISEGAGLTIQPFTLIINSDDYPEFKNCKNNLEVSDLQVVDHTLYALINDTQWGSISNQESGGSLQGCNSRGALAIISNAGASYNMEIKGFTQTRINPKSTSDYPDYNDLRADCVYMMRKGSSELNTNFVGPRKFIAHEKGKLIFADAGAVFEGNPGASKKYLLKRIATYDIATGKLTFKEVDPSLFFGLIEKGDNMDFYQNGVQRS